RQLCGVVDDLRFTGPLRHTSLPRIELRCAGVTHFVIFLGPPLPLSGPSGPMSTRKRVPLQSTLQVEALLLSQSNGSSLAHKTRVCNSKFTAAVKSKHINVTTSRVLPLANGMQVFSRIAID